MNKCINCKYVDLTSKDYPCYVCEDNDRFESAETKRTNFDKLTSSVDVMAEFLAKTTECYFCPVHEIHGVSKCQGEKMCADVLKEWLQKECEG